MEVQGERSCSLAVVYQRLKPDQKSQDPTLTETPALRILLSARRLPNALHERLEVANRFAF